MKIKDQLKIYVFPTIIVLLNKLGISYEKLGKFTFFAKSIFLAQAEELGKFNVDNNSEKQNIYILMMLPGSTFHLYIEALLALGLKKKGHKITFIIDDNMLPLHELKKVGNEQNWDYNAIKDFNFASKFLNELKLKFIPISKLLEDSEKLIYNNKYDSILESTLLKQYKVGVISDDLPNLEEKTVLIKKSITISNFIGERLVKINPDVVIMSHGIYSTWGPAFEVLNFNKIPILTYSRGKKKYTLVFNWNKTANLWDVSDEWDKVKDKDLTEEQLKEINDYLESRILHKDDVFVYNFGKETSKKDTIQNLGLDSKKPIYTLFTNVLWDAASAQREIAFKTPVEWVIKTIQWFNEHPEKQLIVKIHPAEVIIGTNMPFYDIIISKISPNANVKIIKPKEKINSWSIYDITDLGLVHTTTAGMELPLVNKPCMVVSKTHYRGKGFTIDVNSKEEYFDLLDNYDKLKVDFQKNKEHALKYAYLQFIRYQIPFNMFFEEVASDFRGYRYNSIDLYFEKKIFKNLIDKIIFKRAIFSS